MGKLDSGKRVSNTWVICLMVRNNFAKAELIPDKTTISHEVEVKAGDPKRAWRHKRSPRPIS